MTEIMELADTFFKTTITRKLRDLNENTNIGGIN